MAASNHGKSWRTIWDHEFANYGRRSITFASADCAYEVSVNDEDQEWVSVQFAGEALRWPIYVKEVHEGTYRLSGLTSGADDLLGDCFWYQLVLASPCTVSYWGSQVLVREDREV